MNGKIIYADGTLMDVELNGTCFILDQKPTFPSDLSIITVEGDKGNKVYRNAYVQECASVDGRYWFTFIEENKTETSLRELREDMETALNELLDFVLGGEKDG